MSQWAVTDWAKLFVQKLQYLLRDQRLSKSVVMEQEKSTNTLQENHQEELLKISKRTAIQAWQVWLLKRQH